VLRSCSCWRRRRSQNSVSAVSCSCGCQKLLAQVLPSSSIYLVAYLRWMGGGWFMVGAKCFSSLLYSKIHVALGWYF